MLDADERLAYAVAWIIAKLGHVEPWTRDAACKERPDVNFFPERGEASVPAKAVCARCLCRTECLAFALEQPSPFPGIWGGLSERERRRARRERQLAA